MVRLNEKRGSHVGIVLSFMLFITFVFFMYALLDSKINQQTGKTSALEYVKSKVLENVSANLRTISIEIDDSGTTCVALNSFFTRTGISDNIKVMGKTGNNIDSEKSGQDLEVDRNSETFFRIYESQEFPALSGSSLACPGSSNYVIGLSKEETFVFEERITELIANYDSNYENVKKGLEIGARDEFGLVFTNGDGTLIRTPEKNTTLNVFGDKIPVEYIKNNGEKNVGSLVVLVW